MRARVWGGREGSDGGDTIPSPSSTPSASVGGLAAGSNSSETPGKRACLIPLLAQSSRRCWGGTLGPQCW